MKALHPLSPAKEGTTYSGAGQTDRRTRAHTMSGGMVSCDDRAECVGHVWLAVGGDNHSGLRGIGGAGLLNHMRGLLALLQQRFSH
jgi:hypothetical protein